MGAKQDIGRDRKKRSTTKRKKMNAEEANGKKKMQGKEQKRLPMLCLVSLIIFGTLYYGVISFTPQTKIA